MDNIEKILIDSIENVIRKSKILVSKEINERTICGRLLVEINSFFNMEEKIVADIEYNRIIYLKKDDKKSIIVNYDLIKKFEFYENAKRRFVKEFDSYLTKCKESKKEKKYIYPDIIIHDVYRNNIAMIEVKKYENKNKYEDIFKLATIMTFEKNLKYKHYFFLEYSKNFIFTLYEINNTDGYNFNIRIIYTSESNFNL